MSWFIFIKFDNKIYVLIMSWSIFIKIDIHIICADILINIVIHSILTQKQDNFYI
jgi:hypothetical protein